MELVTIIILVAHAGRLKQSSALAVYESCNGMLHHYYHSNHILHCTIPGALVQYCNIGLVYIARGPQYSVQSCISTSSLFIVTRPPLLLFLKVSAKKHNNYHGAITPGFACSIEIFTVTYIKLMHGIHN